MCASCLAAAPTRADLSSWQSPDLGAAGASTVRRPDAIPEALGEVTSALPTGEATRPSEPVALGPPGPAAGPADAGYDLRELPGLPGSAGLFLSAALSIGAWHVLRTAKHVHLAHLPDWYHTGGPAQVGHAVPFNLDFGSILPCSFDSAVVELVLAPGRVESHPITRLLAQCALILAAPRGPPSAF